MGVRLVGNFVPVNRRGCDVTILFETFGGWATLNAPRWF
jgi:hypothetical protein